MQGMGQFMPLAGSAPHIGTQDNLQKVNEWRIEMVVAKASIGDVISALKQAHPYETPAYNVIEVLDFG